MTNRLRTLLAFSSLLVPAALPAFGGPLAETVRVDVPFAFTAGNRSLPAGSYFVQDDMHVVTLRGKGFVVTLVGISGGEPLTGKISLSFQHTPEGYFLKSVNRGAAPSTMLLTSR